MSDSGAAYLGSRRLWWRTGTRSRADQVRGYDWKVDPGPYVPSFSAYGVTSAAIIE